MIPLVFIMVIFHIPKNRLASEKFTRIVVAQNGMHKAELPLPQPPEK
jgi:hypothetical protein